MSNNGSTVTAVRVMARFRPLNSQERKRQELAPHGSPASKPCVRFEDKCVVHHVSSIDGSEYPYTFDRVFGPETTQAEIYASAAAPITSAVLQGYNGTIFAYGQTSSGKTFTMTGNPDNLHDPDVNGIIPRTIRSIFDGIAEADEDTEFTLSVQYVEIYMERVRDLLAHQSDTPGDRRRGSLGMSYKDNLQISEDSNGVPGLPDAEKVYVGSDEEIFELLQRGNSARATSSTRMNEQSSRSHAVFILSVKQNSPSFSKTGILYLVDLAGSEKVKNTGASGMRLDEAKQINKSLSTLGRVINMLTQGATHVPYRDSKLTRLLQQSLGGNAKTTLLICCSPSSTNVDETKSTLDFGLRAKKIKNRAKVNSQRSREELMRMLRSCERLIDALKARVMELEAKMNIPMSGRFIKDSRKTTKSTNSPSTANFPTAEESGEADSDSVMESSHIKLRQDASEDIFEDNSAGIENQPVSPDHIALLSDAELMRKELVKTRETLRSLVEVAKTRERDMANLENSMEEQRERINLRESECDTKMHEIKSALEFVVTEKLQKERDDIRQMREAAERELSSSQVEFVALRNAVLAGISDAVEKEKIAQSKLAELQERFDSTVDKLKSELKAAESRHDEETNASQVAAESRAKEITDLKLREESLTKEMAKLQVENVRNAAESTRVLSSVKSEMEQLREQMNAEIKRERDRVASVTKLMERETSSLSSKLKIEKDALVKMRAQSERFEEEKRIEEEKRVDSESALSESMAIITRLEREKEQEAKNANEALSSLATLEVDLATNTKSLAAAQQEIDIVKSRNTRLDGEVKSLSIELEKRGKDQESMSKRTGLLESQLQEEKSIATKLRESADSAAKRAKTEIDALKLLLENAEKKAEFLSQEKQKLSEQTKKTDQEFRERVNQMEEEATSRLADNNNLVQQISTLQQELDDRSTELSEEKRLRQAANARVKTCQDGLERERKEIEKLNLCVNKSEANLNAEKKRSLNLLGELSEMRGKNEVLTARIDEQLVLIDGDGGLRAEAAKVSALESRIAILNSDLVAVRSENAEMKVSFDNFRATASSKDEDSSKTIALKSREIEHERGLRTEARRINTDLKRELELIRDTAQSTEKRLYEDLQNAKERCGRLEQQRNDSEERAQNLQGRLEKIRVELREAQTQLVRSKTASEGQEAASRRQEKAYEAVLQQIKEQEAECRKLRDSLEQMQQEAAKAHDRYTLIEEARDKLHRMIEGDLETDNDSVSSSEIKRSEGLRARAARVLPLEARVAELVKDVQESKLAATQTEENLRSQLHGAHQKNMETEQACSELRKELSRIKQSLEEKIARLEDEKAKSISKMEGFKNMKTESDKKWEAKVRAQEDLVVSGRAEMSRISGRLDELQARIEEGKLREQSIVEERNALEGTIEDLRDQLKKERDLNSAKAVSIAKWQERSEKFQSNISKQANELKIIFAERNALKAQIDGGVGEDGKSFEGLRSLAHRASILEVKLSSQQTILSNKEAAMATLEQQLSLQHKETSELEHKYGEELTKLKDRCIQESARADAAEMACEKKDESHRSQVAHALEVARQGEKETITKMREEHRKAMVSANEGYAARLRSVEVQYTSDIKAAKEHFAREMESMKQRHERHVERIEQKLGEEKQIAIEDCIQCSRSEHNMEMLAASREHEKAMIASDREHQQKMQELRSQLEREKENAVETCLSSTLEEMSAALETAHAQRRDDVRAVRDEWKRQMKDAIDKQAQAHTKQIEKLRKSMESSNLEKVQSAQEEMRKKMTAEIRKAVAKMQHELEIASSKTSDLKKALELSESRCTAAEEALKKSRQQRQQNFEEMNQLYTAQAAEEAAAAAAAIERQKSTRSSGGGFFSRMFGGGSSTPKSSSSSTKSEDYLVVDSNGASTTLHTPLDKTSKGRGGKLGQSPHGRSPSTPDSTLGTRYATLIESYSAMMGQVELLGDQLLEERTRVSELEDDIAKRVEREADLKARIESYRGRLDDNMLNHSHAGFDSSHSPNDANDRRSSWGLSASRNRRDVLKIDALEGHVTRLQELLMKADEDQDELRAQLVAKTKELRHREMIHEQSVKKLMEMQRREMERGKMQVEQDKLGVRRTNSGNNAWFAMERESGKRSRSNSMLSLSSSSSGDGYAMLNSGAERRQMNVRVPLRGGGGRSKRLSPKSRTIIGIPHSNKSENGTPSVRPSSNSVGLSASHISAISFEEETNDVTEIGDNETGKGNGRGSQNAEADDSHEPPSTLDTSSQRNDTTDLDQPESSPSQSEWL